MNTKKNRELTGQTPAKPAEPAPAPPAGNVLLASGEVFWTHWIDWLKACGVLAPGEQAQRVVIEIALDDVVRVFVERKGCGELLAVRPPQVVLTKRPEASAPDGVDELLDDAAVDNPAK